MKQSNRMIDRLHALTAAALFVVAATPLFAIGASQSEAADMSDEKLKAVAQAYIDVFKINQSYKPRIEAAESTEEADQLQQAANQEMIEVIQDQENVTVNEYNEVLSALGDDAELRERLQAQVDELQQEESESN